MWVALVLLMNKQLRQAFHILCHTKKGRVTALAVLGWVLEGVIIGFAMKHVKGEDNVEASPQQLLCLRYFISMIVYAVIVLLVIKGYAMAGAIVS